MGKSRLRKAAATQAAASEAVDPVVQRAFGLRNTAAKSSLDSADSTAYIALKYFDSAFECFSDWDQTELRHFSGLINTLGQCTWSDVRSHSGLRCKRLDLATVQAGRERLEQLHSSLSPDIDFIELRVTRAVRVHGFRVESAFFLVLLDRQHRVYPER